MSGVNRYCVYFHTRLDTNEIFKSIREAADFIGISPSTLRAKLSGQNKNNTTLRYLKNDK